MKKWLYRLLSFVAVGAWCFSVCALEVAKDVPVFQHHNGQSSALYYPEIVGSGVALFDFDNDGDLDVYFVQSGAFENNTLSDQLWLNETEQGSLKLKPAPHTTKAQTAYGIAVASGDVNQDGFVDLMLSQLGTNHLLLNQGGQQFKQVALAESIPNSFSASASFCDVNNDGWLDLYVSNYVHWSAEQNPKCHAQNSQRDYCGPASFAAQKDDFYLNQQGQLKLATAEFFPDMQAGPGLGVVCRDLNQDGWADLVVANDGAPNYYWVNQQGKSFKEQGLLSGLAVNGQGAPEASMGIAVADYDLDGDWDVFYTHLAKETNTLLKNVGKGFFVDTTSQANLGSGSFAMTGWGVGFLAVNDDVRPDLLVLNGAVAHQGQSAQSTSNALGQSNQLYVQKAQGYQLMTLSALAEPWATRGAAFGDLDNDGDADVVLSNNNGPSQILLNTLDPKAWFGLRLVQPNQVRSMRLVNKTNDQKRLLTTISDGSYASANDIRVRLNAAETAYFNELEVHMLDGTTQRIDIQPNYRYQTWP